LSSKPFAEIIPYLFNDKLIIALSNQWLDYFKKIPRFKALLDEKGNLVLIASFDHENDKFQEVKN